MKTVLFLLLLASGSSVGKEQHKLGSCISYEFSAIDKSTGEFILRNVFAPELFDSLKVKFPEKQLDWTAWTTSVSEFDNEDGKRKTKLKGCFDVYPIKDDSELIASIMKVSAKRFQAAMKFYSKPSSKHIPQEKVDKMIDGYKGLIEDEKVKNAIDEKIDGTW